MLSNFDIEEIANHYNVDVVIVMKDELKNMKPISTNYISVVVICNFFYIKIRQHIDIEW